MQLSIRHTTEYRYDSPVDYALQKLRLRPVASPMQEVPDWQIDIEGGKIETGYLDHYGNHVDLVSLTPGGQTLVITAHGRVETQDKSGVLGKVYGRAPLWHFQQPTPPTRPGARVRALSAAITGAEDSLAGLHALSTAIIEAVPYTTGETHSHTTAEEALKLGRGVCQDHAQIFVAAARLAGIPARYVSGYLMMNDRVDQDASHAWAEAHLETLGWVGFDVSNGISPDERYVRLAIGRDARDAAPVEGLRLSSAGEEMIVSLQVQQ